MVYWDFVLTNLDLFQLETFVCNAAGNRLNITLCKMTKLNLSLILGIFDAMCTYFVIMVQFDLANRRAENKPPTANKI